MSSYPDEVDEMVILVRGEDGLEELHQVGLLSDWERPGIHVDALGFQDLLEGILLRMVLELEVGDVLFHQDVGVPGGDDVRVIYKVGDLYRPELVVPGMRTEGCLDPVGIQGGFMNRLTDVLGELSDRSADVNTFFS